MSSTNREHLHYSMIIQWSDEDRAYIVSIPEFPGNFTHGDTYEEAVKQGRDLIESLIMWTQQDGKPLPNRRSLPDADLSCLSWLSLGHDS